jgi:hypothetical protein
VAAHAVDVVARGWPDVVEKAGDVRRLGGQAVRQPADVRRTGKPVATLPSQDRGGMDADPLGEVGEREGSALAAVAQRRGQGVAPFSSIDPDARA